MCCGWALTLVAWCMGEYSPKKYEDSSDSEEPPMPRFRNIGVLKNRMNKYELRPTKNVCYAEVEDGADFD